jgi:hypothetical protein
MLHCMSAAARFEPCTATVECTNHAPSSHQLAVAMACNDVVMWGPLFGSGLALPIRHTLHACICMRAKFAKSVPRTSPTRVHQPSWHSCTALCQPLLLHHCFNCTNASFQRAVSIQAPVAGLGLELGKLKANIYLLILQVKFNGLE